MACMPMLSQHSVIVFGGIGVGDHMVWAGVPVGATADIGTPGMVDTMADITVGVAIGPVTGLAAGAGDGDITITTITGMAEDGIQAVAVVVIGLVRTIQVAVQVPTA